MPITAKVKCNNKVENTDGAVALSFSANYRNDAGELINQDWAYATPHLGINMTVSAEAGALFVQGAEYALTFEVEETTDGESDARERSDVQ